MKANNRNIVFQTKKIIKYPNNFAKRLLGKQINLINYNSLLRKRTEGSLFSILKKNYNKFEINLYYKTYKEIGNTFLHYFIDYCDLKPDEEILEIGCGAGRMAYPLTKYLTNGSYIGMDIKPEVIKWCRKTFTPEYPNFRFIMAGIYNKHYNPKGRSLASSYKFPFKDKFFDFLFMHSIFTHMLPRDMENYFSEISRVLKRNGRCLITFLILNAKALEFVNTKKGLLYFKYNYKEYRTINKNLHEAAVAYDENKIRKLYKKYGFKIKEPIYYGSWCGNKDALNFLDVVIAIRE